MVGQGQVDQSYCMYIQCTCTCIYVELEENAQAIGESCLRYLSVLKREKPGSGTIASAGNDLQKTIRGLGRLAGVRL